MTEAVKSVDKILSVDEFLAQNDVEYATVPSFKAGEFLRISSLTAGDLIEWSEANETEAKRTAGLRLITKSIVDKDGTHIGTDKHIPMLRAKSHRLTENIVKAILKLNGMVVADVAKKD